MVFVRLKDSAEIRLLIARRGFTLRGFAKKIGISHSYLSQILNGNKNPSPVVARKISEGLGECIEVFFLIKVVDEQPVIGGVKI